MKGEELNNPQNNCEIEEHIRDPAQIGDTNI